MRLLATHQLLVASAILAVVSISITAQAQRGPAQEALAERAKRMRNKPPFPPGLAEGRLIQQIDDDGDEFDLDEKTRATLDAAVDKLRAAEDMMVCSKILARHAMWEQWDPPFIRSGCSRLFKEAARDGSKFRPCRALQGTADGTNHGCF